MKNIYYNNTQRYFCITTPIILNCEVIGFLARNLPDATFKLLMWLYALPQDTNIYITNVELGKQLSIHPTTVKKALDNLIALEYLTVENDCWQILT